ncbi:MAG: Peptidase M50 [Parcubacteria group bacterium GW2011_GWC1_38_6]|nr:MAG: Peptidase M50 [Parcubacteria group bacterium GW2011_GWA1_36_12]KKQ76697.1 MAG: Peptidase M50 [Parcubacteria group bacterium GW2011_GWC1_38_6]
MDFSFVFIILVLLFSVVLHEVSHGVIANHLGDSTAKNLGRLTLNPIPHLDLFGSILLPLFLVLVDAGIVFGWAKPVPVNPFNLRDQKYGYAKVALAGPASNLSLALVFGLILRFLPDNFFNPSLFFILTYIVFINIILAVFNLVPIPPLDGSHVLFAVLPDTMNDAKHFLSRYSFVIFFVVLFLFFDWIILATNFIFKAITGFAAF